jgi:hypothetical protein
MYVCIHTYVHTYIHIQTHMRTYTQGKCIFDEEHTYIGIKVSKPSSGGGDHNSDSDTVNQQGRPHVYVGVCAGDFDPSTQWYAEVASQGMPTECIVWGIGERTIIERNGSKQQTFDVSEGVPYTEGEVVCIRVRNGFVSFTVADPDNFSGTPRVVASVPSPKNAVLRPFVAVCGHALRCSVVTSSTFMKKEDKAASGMCVCVYMYACVCVCVFSVYACMCVLHLCVRP